MTLPADAWPTARLDPVRRLRVLAAALPWVALVERELPLPYEQVWSFLSDVERNVPRYDRFVPWLRVTRREGEDLRLLAGPIPFRARLTDGFVWMQAPRHLYVVGQAARPTGPERTRLAHLEGVPSPLGRLLFPLVRRHVRHDMEGIARALGVHSGRPDGGAIGGSPV